MSSSAVAARGFRPPRFVTSIDVDSPKGDDSPSVTEYPGLRQTWSTSYRRIAETGPSRERPFSIYLLGVKPPADARTKDLKIFNDFYTNVHLVEVVERRHALRATRYELVEEVRPPYLGAPRFLAIYLLDEEISVVKQTPRRTLLQPRARRVAAPCHPVASLVPKTGGLTWVDGVRVVVRHEVMQFDGNATVRVVRAQRIQVAHHGNPVAVIEVIVAARARVAPRQYFRQLCLCHGTNINGGCDIVVDVTQRRCRTSLIIAQELVEVRIQITFGNSASSW